jgi:hypothetical protein
MRGTLRIFLFFATLSFAVIAYGESQLVYFGGSTAKDDSSFDTSLNDALAYAKSKNLKADFFYRKTLPKTLADEDSAKIKEFTPKSFKKKIRELARSISSGKIKPGEQLLVYLDTHGSKIDGTYKVTADTELANGEDLQYLIQAAERKNVRLGIINGTCYSGSLMKYRTPHTCIVTSAQPDKVGFAGDPINLAALSPGLDDLESLYLLQRSLYPGLRSQPMISTEAGIRVDEMLSPLKSSIIHEHDRDVILAQPTCKTPTSSLVNLEKEINTLKASTRETPEWAAETIKDLRDLIEKFNSTKLKLQAYNIAKNKETCVDTTFMEGAKVNTDYEKCLTQEDIEWVAANYYKPGESRQSRKGLTTGTKQLADPIRSQFIDQQNSDNYKNFQRLKKENQEAIHEIDIYSAMIGALERDIYNKAYKKASEESKAPNPCRDFKL